MMAAQTVGMPLPESNSAIMDDDNGGDAHVIVMNHMAPPPVGDARMSFGALRLSTAVLAGPPRTNNSAPSKQDSEESPLVLASVVPSAVVWTPFANLQNVPVAPRSAPPQRCGSCGSFLARGNGADALQRLEPGLLAWNCVFCGKQNELAVGPSGIHVHGVGAAEWLANELTGDTVDYVVEGVSVSRSTADPGSNEFITGSFAGPTCGRRGVAVLVDENLKMPEAREVMEAVKDLYFDCVSGGSKFMLILFGAAVSVAVVSEAHSEALRDGTIVLDTLTPVQAEVLPITKKLLYFTGSERETESELEAASDEKHAFMTQLLETVICGYNVDEGEDHSDEISDAIEPSDKSEISPPSLPAPYRILASEKPRVLSQAIEVALELIEGVVDAENTRFISFVSGVPTLATEQEPSSFSSVFHTDAGSTNPATDNSDLVFDDTASMTSRASRATSIVSLQDDPFAALRPQRASQSSARQPEHDEDSSWLSYVMSGFGFWNSPEPADTETGHAVRDPENPNIQRASVASEDTDMESKQQKKNVEEKAAPRSNSPELERVFEVLGRRAGERRLGLFFISYATEEGCDARALHAAASKSRGGVVYTAPHGFPTTDGLKKVALHLARVPTSAALVSIRASPPLRVAHVIGPAIETAAPETYAVSGADPELGFVIILEVDQVAALKPNFPTSAMLQFSAKSFASTRVISLQMPFESDRSRYLESIDTEIAAVALAKVCLADAGGAAANSYRLAGALDATIGKLLAVSPPMVSIANLLFYLRRGPLVERHEGLDESLVLRALFHRADCSMSTLILAPRVFSTNTNAATMVEASPSTEVMTQSNTVSVIDAGVSVFVWIGAESTSEARNTVIQSAQDITRVRGLAQLFIVPENNALEDTMLAYLAPKLEHDADIHQQASMRNICEMPFVRYVALLRRKQISSGRKT